MEIVNKSFRRVRRANQGLWAMSDGSWVSDGFMTQDSRLKTLHADRWNDVGQEKEAKRQTLLEIVECATESWSRFT